MGKKWDQIKQWGDDGLSWLGHQGAKVAAVGSAAVDTAENFGAAVGKTWSSAAELGEDALFTIGGIGKDFYDVTAGPVVESVGHFGTTGAHAIGAVTSDGIAVLGGLVNPASNFLGYGDLIDEVEWSNAADMNWDFAEASSDELRDLWSDNPFDVDGYVSSIDARLLGFKDRTDEELLEYKTFMDENMAAQKGTNISLNIALQELNKLDHTTATERDYLDIGFKLRQNLETAMGMSPDLTSEDITTLALTAVLGSIPVKGVGVHLRKGTIKALDYAFGQGEPLKAAKPVLKKIYEKLPLVNQDTVAVGSSTMTPSPMVPAGALGNAPVTTSTGGPSTYVDPHTQWNAPSQMSGRWQDNRKQGQAPY